MTRKDFQLIADVIADATISTREVLTDTDAELELAERTAIEHDRDRIARAFADRLAADNPCFKRATFLEACRVAP